MHSGGTRGACITQSISCAVLIRGGLTRTEYNSGTCDVSLDAGIQAGLQLLRRDDSDFS